MKRFALSVFACLLVTAAAAQGLGERTGINAVVGAAPSTADFVKIAAISDMFEIESSKLAEARGDDRTKTFASRMVQDHTKTSSELKPLAAKAGADVPTAMDSSHQTKLDKLKGLNGADFSKEYAAMQVDAHEDAVSLFERYAKGGDHAELKGWAEKTLPHLRQHLEMAKALKK